MSTIKKELFKKLNIDEQDLNKKLEVGFFKESVYPDGQSVAQVAYANEFGKKGIPPRPFFRNCYKEKEEYWIKSFNDLLMSGVGLLSSYKMTGEKIRGDLVMSITKFSNPPNAPSTIKKKGSSNPLIDTGQLRRSVNFQIRSIK